MTNYNRSWGKRQPQRTFASSVLAFVAIVFLVAAGIALGLGWLALITALVAWVYNTCVATPFGWHVLTFWQTAGILFLLSIVGGFFRTTVTRVSK